MRIAINAGFHKWARKTTRHMNVAGIFLRAGPDREFHSPEFRKRVSMFAPEPGFVLSGYVRNENVERLEPPPKWALESSFGFMDVGSALATKDGRKIGNACVMQVREADQAISLSTVQVLTDAGNFQTFVIEELDQLFHKPEWTMDPETCPGAMALIGRRA
jgi:hypothetical protein